MQNRRRFLKTTFLTTLVMVFSQEKLFASVTPLQTLAVLQGDIFPQKMLQDANALEYANLVFSHSRIRLADKQFLRNGAKWLNEESVSLFGEVYVKLSPKQRQSVLGEVAKTSWGKSYITTVLGYIMEAVLGDPIYGINKNQSGWKWLHYTSGFPRPKGAYL